MLHFAAVAYEHLWMSRNKLMRGEQLPHITDISTIINNLAHQYYIHTAGMTMGRNRAPIEESWLPPPPGILKINIDTAFDGGHAFSRIVFRNSRGVIVHAFTAHNLATSAFEAEALTVVHAMKVATQMHIEKAIFEGDGITVILGMNGADSFVHWSGTVYIKRGRDFFVQVSFLDRFSHK